MSDSSQRSTNTLEHVPDAPGTRGRPPVLVAGVSVRAAAMSLKRAGFQPIAADMFADYDTRRVAEVHPLGDQGLGQLAAMAERPDWTGLRWCYTGGFENVPDLVEALSTRLRLYGNPADVLRCIRDPFTVHDILVAAGLPALPVRPPRNPPPHGANWLLKPRRSGGGRGIRRWRSGSPISERHAATHYLQQQCCGVPASAAFLATNRRAILLGVTHQLTGVAAHPTLAFQYCGSLAPLALSEACRHSIARIGQSLVSATGLRGVFGIDLIVESQTPWLVEVNPRFTASMELFEHPDRLSVMGRHMQSFQDSAGSPSQHTAAGQDAVCGRPAPEGGVTSGPATSHECALKVIAYLASGGSVSQSLHGQLVTRSHQLADLPMPGVHLRAGDPLCTVLVRGRGFRDLITQSVRLWSWLRRQAGELTWTAARLRHALEAAHDQVPLGTNTS